MTSKEALEMIVVDLVPKAKENNKEEIELIEKDLEVLEIIKNKLGIDKNDLMITRTTTGENYYFCEEEITKEEFDLLKEWLENGK